jgi:tRNA (guanosine-2'-O-)-methyltransferase
LKKNTLHTIEKLIEYLSQFTTDHKLRLFDELIAYRTRYLTVVLEDIYQSQNASAVIRTCDCLGIQNVHVIENNNKFTVNPDVVLGSVKWINLIRHNQSDSNTIPAINKLRKNGYRIVATSSYRNDTELHNFDLANGKVALLFGTELKGLSEDALANADEFLRIGMYGFTESFNISVSAGIILHHLIEKLHKSEITWQLTKKEASEIKLNWLRNTVKKADALEKEFLKNFYSD